jgi:hypothetical protein
MNWFLQLPKVRLHEPAELIRVNRAFRALDSDRVTGILRDLTFRIVTEPELTAWWPRGRPVQIVPRLELLSISVNGEEHECPRLVFYFKELLWKYCDRITPCPHCHFAFILFRKNAVYCSRECQSVAYMRKVRGRRTVDKPTQKPKGEGHGQKRRA